MSLGIKEKVILGSLGPAMNLISDWSKDIKPENEVSKFVEANIGTLFKQQSDKENGNAIILMLSKLAVAEANDNPEYVLHKLLAFYEALRVWYPEYRKKEINQQTQGCGEEDECT